jgi:predicted DNA-binding transcriptional regulator AlpA
MKIDRTFNETSLYGSVTWVAATLGLSKTTFCRKLPALDGFPRRDRVTGLYVKADVQEWVERQRTLADRATTTPKPQNREPNYDQA